MSDRDDPARDDRKSPVRLPGLVVWEEERTGVEKVLDRIRRLLGGGTADADEEGVEAPRGRAGTRAPIEPMPLPDTGRSGDADDEDEDEPPDPPREPLDRTTLQMLPGRLEPVNPRIVRQELRFLRVPGPEQEITVGSAPAEPPGHVTVDHGSVQPLHARMRFEGGAWTIESLTDVDPVRLNREPIGPESGAHPLVDGDTVRLGRAEFVFRIP